MSLFLFRFGQWFEFDSEAECDQTAREAHGFFFIGVADGEEDRALVGEREAGRDLAFADFTDAGLTRDELFALAGFAFAFFALDFAALDCLAM